MHTVLFRLTPDSASKFLENNKSNRPLSKYTVGKYAADMLAANWRLTHQGLLIGKNGVLIDGQHRCHAVVRSGIAIDTLATFDDTLTEPLDVPIDCGAARGNSFILGVSKREAAVAAFIHARLRGSNIVSAAALRPYVEFVKDELGLLSNTACRGISQAPVQAAAVVRIKQHPESAEYVSSAYAAMLRADFDFMAKAPLVGSFYKQFRSRGANSFELFTLAFKAFDMAGRHKGKLQIHRSSDSASEAAVKVLSTLWEARG